MKNIRSLRKSHFGLVNRELGTYKEEHKAQAVVCVFFALFMSKQTKSDQDLLEKLTQ